MRPGKILLTEPARVQQRHRKSITERQRRRGARGRGEVERTRFLGDSRIEVHVRLLCQRRIRVAGHGDELGALALYQRNDREQLVRLAGIREGEHHVVTRYHPEIAVAGLGGVQEKCRRSRARHGGRDLARNVSGLAHAAHHYAPAARKDQADRIEKTLVEPRGECTHRVSLDREHLPRELERRVRRYFFRAIVHRMKPLWPVRVARFMIGRRVYQTDQATPPPQPKKTRTSRWAGRSNWC